MARPKDDSVDRVPLRFPGRHAVVQAFSSLAPEAFDFVCTWLMQKGPTSGGFRTDSKDGLQRLSTAAREFLIAKQTEDGPERREPQR